MASEFATKDDLLEVVFTMTESMSSALGTIYAELIGNDLLTEEDAARRLRLIADGMRSQTAAAPFRAVALAIEKGEDLNGPIFTVIDGGKAD